MLSIARFLFFETLTHMKWTSFVGLGSRLQGFLLVKKKQNCQDAATHFTLPFKTKADTIRIIQVTSQAEYC